MSKPQLLAMFAALSIVFSVPAGAAPAPEKWAFWDRANEASTATIDHSLWQAVLDKYLVESPDNINRFLYSEVSGEGRSELTSYLQLMAALDPREFNALEQQAYWINFYNALTVDLVLKYPKKGSILRMGERFFSIGPWDDKVVTVAGEELTLNDIEHRILRPIFQDHRVHYAVNCASIGCPNLAATAFSAADLEAQLATAESDYINHARGVTIDNKGRVQLSQIFEWYRDDFAADTKGLLQYLAMHHASLGDTLQKYTGKVRYEYDWDLNKAE